MPNNGIANSALLDLIATTTENLPDLDFEVALNYQSYLVCDKWFKTDKIQVESGTSIKRNIILDDSGNAMHVRLFQKVPVNVADVQRQITAPWVQARTHYTIERREALRNRKPSKFVDLVKSRRIDGMVSLADLLERDGWKSPVSSSDDLNPRGLPYWLNKVISSTGTGYSASLDLTTGGFVGRRVIYTDGTSSVTDVGGISPTIEAKWRNYAGIYSAVSTSDLMREMRKAFYSTMFKSPMLVKDLEQGPLSKYRIYMPRNVLIQSEELAQTQNVGSDNLGPDLAKFHGITAFRRVPLEYAPLLDADASDPVYMVNHNNFYPIVQEGDWLRENEPQSDVESNNVFVTIIDNSYQFFCTNRRTAGAVLHKTLSGATEV